MLINTDQLKSFIENPVTTIAVAVPMTIGGLVDKILAEPHTVHGLLTDVSITVGIFAGLALGRVHWLRGNREKIRNLEAELHLRREEREEREAMEKSK